MAEDNRTVSRPGAREIATIPAGPLGLVPLKGCESFAEKIDSYLVKWRKERQSEHKDNILFAGYQKDSYIVKADCPRFGSGEAKGVIKSSVRGDDLYFISDVTNHSLTYSVGGLENRYSPDDHFADLKRLIAAASGRARPCRWRSSAARNFSCGSGAAAPGRSSSGSWRRRASRSSRSGRR